MKKRVLLAALAFLPACATSFRGSAHVTPAQCRAGCSELGGTMAAFVYMGDYSTACVCEPPEGQADASSAVVGAVSGAVAGVWMQMQRNDEARRRR